MPRGYLEAKLTRTSQGRGAVSPTGCRACIFERVEWLFSHDARAHFYWKMGKFPVPDMEPNVSGEVHNCGTGTGDLDILFRLEEVFL